MYSRNLLIRNLLIALVATIACTAARAQQAPAPSSAATNPSAVFEPEIAAFETHDKAMFPPAGAVLFVGSSSIRMWHDLESAFPPNVVINRGFGGSEIRDSTYFADRIIIPYHPRMVVLYAGDNDIAEGKTPEQVFADFREFTSKVRASLPDAKIAFISIKPSIARWKLVDRMKEANQSIRRYIRKQKHMVYIDIFDATLGKDGQPRPELFKEDGLHPSAEAYALWQKRIAPFLK